MMELRRILLDGYPTVVRPNGDQLQAFDGRSVSQGDAIHLPPTEPRKIICVHLNYRSRVDEYMTKLPPAPTYFHKPVTALNSHGGDVVRPEGCQWLNYEGEIAVVIGSHCVGLDMLLGRLQDRGYQTKFLAVGSTAGLAAARRWQCDVAGIHLLDAKTGQYNRPFLSPDLELIPGYGRLQGIVFRQGDERFEDKAATEAIAAVQDRADCVMVNRNQGSGTRILIDQMLCGTQPTGYAVQARGHNAVVAAVVQGRADWGVTIETVARRAGLTFRPLRSERYDFAVYDAMIVAACFKSSATAWSQLSMLEWCVWVE